MSLAKSLAKAARSLVRVPGIAAALASLALGIGATSAVLRFAESLLFSGAPGISEPRRLAGVHMATSPGNPYGGNSYLNVLDLRALSRTFEDLAAYYPVTVSLAGEDGAEPISAEAVSGNYFGLLGASPVEGRLLHPDDDRLGAEPAAVVSYAFWRDRLGRKRDLEAIRLVLNGTRFTVVGVAAVGFRGPSLHGRADAWIPLGTLPRVASGPVPADVLQDRGAQWLSVVGRLKAGISSSQAQSELEAIRHRLAREAGTAAWGRPMTVTDWREVTLGKNRAGSERMIGTLAVCSLIILLIACGNVAHLLAGRALVRRSEVALRLALGARRGRAALPLAAECFLLGLAAYGGSLVVQHLLSKILLKLGLPLTGFDVRWWSPGSLVLALGVAAAATILGGLWPVISVSRQSLADVMKSPRLSTIGPTRFRAGKALVTLEAALSMMLLVAGLLLLASARNVLAIAPGFDPEGVVYAFVDLGAKKYSAEQADAFYGALLESLRHDRSIAAASLTTFLPFEGSLSWTVYRPGSEGAGETPSFGLDIVDQSSFEAMGIPILRGRDFRSEDRGNGAVIVNQAMARALWPGEEALGRSIGLEGSEDEFLEVIGIAGDARYSSPTEPPAPHFYLYRRYRDHAGLTTAFSTNLWLLARAEGDPESLVPRVREAVRSIDPDLPVPRLGILEDHVRSFTARSRFVAVLLGLLGGAGLLLAAGGVYAVVLSSLLARRHEIAVRMALGASPREILRMALKEAGLLSSAGILLGAMAAYLLAHLVEAQLFGISAREPLAFVAAAVALFVVSLAGSFLPARKVSQSDSALLLKNLE